MPKVPVYNLSREAVGELDLADDVFSTEVNEALFYDVVKAQLASRRAGTHKVKSRSEVAATGKKMYRQKGTGRARHGDAKAPIFRGGGPAFGPKPRDYSWRPTRKMRKGALRSALALKLKEGRLMVVDDFQLPEIKTKGLVQVLDALRIGRSSVLVDEGENQTLRMSARNLPKHQFLPPEGVNVYDLLRHEHLVVTKTAVAALEARCK
ncbi:MAG: 50S ribosomal protein L4 [Sandaracinaceae bacterium]